MPQAHLSPGNREISDPFFTEVQLLLVPFRISIHRVPPCLLFNAWQPKEINMMMTSCDDACQILMNPWILPKVGASGESARGAKAGLDVGKPRATFCCMDRATTSRCKSIIYDMFMCVDKHGIALYINKYIYIYIYYKYYIYIYILYYICIYLSKEV